MLVYRKGKLGENAKIVKTINNGFSDVKENADFQKLMPKVYKKDGLEHHSLLCFDKDLMVGALTVWPTFFEVGKEVLNVSYIGSVAVIPQARNKGIMSKMMEFSLDEIDKNNYDLSILSGQRQRYQYFGFYPFGFVYEFLFNGQNIKHTVKKEHKYKFLEIESNDNKYLDDIYMLYQKRLFKARPKDNFFDYLKSRDLKVFVVLNNNEFYGYYLVRDEVIIYEIELLNFEDVRYVLTQILTTNNLLQLKIVIMPFERNKFKVLNEFTENYLVYFKDLAKISNFEKTLKLLLKLTNKVEKLEDGNLVIEIIDYGTLELIVKGEEILVNKINKLTQIKLTKEEVTSLTTPHFNSIIQYKNWFPLLVSIPFADSF